jgi:GDP-4-dehydro-6-deoxy-D-mannose reductase
VVASSGTVYRASDKPLDERAPLGPNNPYAVSKLAEEELARHAARVDGLDIVVARPFNHIGPGQSAQFAVAEFARQIVAIERGAPPVITIGNLDARRDFTDVRDVVNAYALLAELPTTTAGSEDRTFNICSGHARSMREILDRLLALARVEVTVQQDASRLRPNDTPVFVGDFGRVAAATGWSPAIPLDTTLADVLADWRARTPSA